MTANGKTLTVTYGAFACTIDGYDDPMPVLRSVVAFFRELTAEDPAFGTQAPKSPEPAAAPPARPSPLTPEEIASLAAPEPGESRLTAAVSTQAARATLFTPAAPEEDEEEEDLLAATMPRPRNEPVAEEEPPARLLTDETLEDEPSATVITPAAWLEQEPLLDAESWQAPAAEAARGNALPRPLILTPDLRIDRAPVELMPHEIGEETSLASREAPLPLTEFLRQTGAEELGARMEAAAAHAIALEGRESVSRPALLRAVQSAGAEPVPFEEALKAFGMLLRAGRLQKTDQGRYVVAGDSPYLARAQALIG